MRLTVYKNLTLSKLKTLYLLFNKNIIFGGGTTVYYKSNVYAKLGKIIIGNRVKVGRDKRGYHASLPFYTTLLTDKQDAEIMIGNNCRINGAYIHAQNKITIGDNCVIASGVNIIDSNGHQLISKNRTIDRDEPKPIAIGNNVWIGMNVIILKGTIIGNNCVVAAGSVVKGNFSDNSIIQGNPAKVVSVLPIE